MKIWAIFKKEIFSYFVSPLFYVVTSVFILISSFFFVLIVFNTQSADMRDIFANMVIILLLVSPLLTMRLVAEEKRQGTDELLFTSPLKSADVILGKFLAAVVLLAIILIISFQYPFILITFGNPDIGPIYAGYIGLFLTGAAYFALGMIGSSLTHNPVIAALLSFLFLLFFWLIGWAGTLVGAPWNNFFQQISILQHYTSFEKGVIDTTDIFYYLSFIFASLFISVQILETRRW